MDLLQKKNGQYRNSPMTQAFLVEYSPTYLGSALEMLHIQNSLGNLTRLIREGPPTAPEMTFSEEMFVQDYASIELAGDARIIVDVVSKLPEFLSFHKMLDLGGGPGLIGMAVVAAHPSMKGVIFDLPPMVKAAETFIKKYKMDERMKVLGARARANHYEAVIVDEFSRRSHSCRVERVLYSSAIIASSSPILSDLMGASAGQPMTMCSRLTRVSGSLKCSRILFCVASP